MTKKDKGTETYFVHLDIGAGVKLAGITFDKQGVPHAVPELWVETFENSPVFSKVESGDKTLTPAECAVRLKAEMKAYTERRDAWRKDHAAGTNGKPTFAPPEPGPAPKPAPKPGASKEEYK